MKSWQRIIDNWFVYETVRVARIQHTGLALAFYAGCLLIAGYIIVIEIAMYGGHLNRQSIQGWSHFSISSPRDKNGHTFTPDDELPYCERFVKQTDGGKSKLEHQLPCSLFDARDAEMGNMDDTSVFVPSRVTIFSQQLGCPEHLSRESGYFVNHSSYFCTKLWWGAKKPDWDGYMIDPERFRVVIQHGVKSSASQTHKASHGLFSARRMQGFYWECNHKTASTTSTGEDCVRKKIPCLHKHCGMTAEEEEEILTSLTSSHVSSSVQETSSFSEVSSSSRHSQGNADRHKAENASRLRKLQSLSRNNNLRLGLQNHLGLLEFIPPDVKGNGASRYTASNISQDNTISGNAPNTSSSFPDEISSSTDTEIDDEGQLYRGTWKRIRNNIDLKILSSLNLDEGIVQGRHGLVTSIGFLLRLAGIPSLDQTLQNRGWTADFIPREKGINLKITFDYTNVDRYGLQLYPMSTPIYTMKVEPARPAVYMVSKRLPEHNFYNETQRRKLHIAGVKIMATRVGELATFELGPLLIVLTSGLGLLAALVKSMDLICTYVLPFSDEFEARKYIESSLDTKGLGAASPESDADVPPELTDTKNIHSREASGVESIEHGDKHVLSMMKAMERRLAEMEANDRERVKRLKEMEARDCAKEERLKEMEAKDCEKEARIKDLAAKDCLNEERLKEMATKIAQLEASTTR